MELGTLIEIALKMPDFIATPLLDLTMSERQIKWDIDRARTLISKMTAEGRMDCNYLTEYNECTRAAKRLIENYDGTYKPQFTSLLQKNEQYLKESLGYNII